MGQAARLLFDITPRRKSDLAIIALVVVTRSAVAMTYFSPVFWTVQFLGIRVRVFLPTPTRVRIFSRTKTSSSNVFLLLGTMKALKIKIRCVSVDEKTLIDHCLRLPWVCSSANQSSVKIETIAAPQRHHHLCHPASY